MAKYLIIGFSARFNGGVIGLTPEQASERSHNLNPCGEGMFEILNPIEFKRGEIVEFEGEVNLRLLEAMASAAPASPDPLDDLTKKEIVLLAQAEGLTLDGSKNKGILITSLTDYRAQRAAKEDRILALEAKGDDLTDEEMAEYLELKG